jgi:hypothetical protein
MRAMRVRPARCPACAWELDGATSMFGNHTPKGGDVTVCINCCAILEFTSELDLEATDTTKLPLDVLDELAEVQAAIRKVKAAKPVKAGSAAND